MSNQLEPKAIALAWYSKKEILKNSVCEVQLPLSFDSFGHPVPDGLYDLRMGVIQRDQQCGTCNQNDLLCNGHMGHITLSSPVINPLLYERLLLLLRTMCLKCHSFKITDFQRMSTYIKLKALKKNIVLDNSDNFVRNKTTEDIEKELYKMSGSDSLQNQLHYRTVDEFFKKYASRSKCPRCGAKLIKISKASRMRIMINGKKKDIGYEISENPEFIIPKDMMQLISQLYINESVLLTEFFNGGDKEMFFLEVLAVIPNKFRPARFVNKEVYENPVNAQLARIIQASNALEAEGQLWSELQENIYCYFDGSKTPRKPTIGIKQVLERKEGLFRSNIMGKRVNYSGRSVISPDPNLHSREVGIPLIFAKALTFPEKVTTFNVEKLREVVRKGINYPGCNYVECDGVLTNMEHISTGMRLAIARQLSSGHKVVWRHMVNGDYVLLNRQPTLHSVGLMGHKVRVLQEGETLRLHYVNCKSYNADFDGDEMNIHFPQSFPAMAECRLLANTDNNYCVQATGNPIRGLEQDHIIGAVALSFKDSFFTRDEYFQLIYNGLQMNNWFKRINIIQPCILWPVNLYSGKQILSSLFRSMGIYINYSKIGKLDFNKNIFKKSNKCNEINNINYQNKFSDKSIELYYKQENLFLVRNGIIISGIVDKNIIGASVNSFVHACGEIYNYKICNDILAAISGVVNAYLRNRGFTVRFDDLLMDNDYNNNRHKIFQRSNDNAIKMQNNDLDLFKNDYFYLNDNEIRILDSKMRQFINDSISEAVNYMENGLFKKKMHNNMLKIILTGAKGSIVNLSQITCALGQQELESQRVPFMRSGKTLPCFEKLEKCPAAGGCVYERFLTGLNPATFYFYCMAGREGLIDTAVKTANSGYLQRSLIKHLEAIKVDYDGTVRNGERLIQYNYGEDGLDCLKTYFIDNIDYYSKNIHLFKEFYTKTDNNITDNKKLINFINKKKEVARIDPGKCVGILAAQSIGEPSTQMTLNTFHLAGVGGKNVTLGIPRLREILMIGSKYIKTPVIIAKIRSLSNELVNIFNRYTLSDCLDKINLIESTIIRGNQYCKKISIHFIINKMEELCVKIIENDFLKALTKEIKKKNSSIAIAEYSTSDTSKILNDDIKIEYTESTINDSEDTEIISSIKREEDNDDYLEENIHNEKLIKLDSNNYILDIIYPIDFNIFLMPLIECVADKLIVREIPGFTKASINGDKLIMVGSSFGSIHNTYFGINLTEVIDWTDSYSNDIYAIYSYFGIEAARTCIVQEIKNVFDVYGIYINIRHLYLIADYMTRNGNFSPFNRSAFTMEDSFIQKMSFESCYLNLKKSAIIQQNEIITNPSTCILLGSNIKQGTGIFDLLYNISSNLIE